MDDPAAIWLSPKCDVHGDGRTWANPAPDVRCDDCGEPWVKYIRAALTASEPLLAQARAQAVEDAWQPIETAPVWEAVLVFQQEASMTKSNRSRVFYAVQFENGEWGLSSGGRKRGEFLFPKPTRWQPLPAPPALAQSEGEGKA